MFKWTCACNLFKTRVIEHFKSLDVSSFVPWFDSMFSLKDEFDVSLVTVPEFTERSRKVDIIASDDDALQVRYYVIS